MTKYQLYPLKFDPILKTKIWGGNSIASYKGIENVAPNTGESWEISNIKNDTSVVSEGVLKGKSLDEIIDEYKELFLGESIYQRFGNEFPLLIKFIDAKEDLSIQVHPNDALARKKHQTNGKTEFWHIINAKENAFLYAGFNKTTTKEEVEAALNNNSICSLLNKESVATGDSFYLPAGRVHAIGEGTFLVEIQQSSDVTYRVWDYNRTDSDGNKRDLHVQDALQAFDYKQYKKYKIPSKQHLGRKQKIQECTYFTVNSIQADTFMAFDYKGLDSFVVWICLEGEAVFSSQRKHNGKISQGETILFPSCDMPTAIIPTSSNVKILETYIG